MAGVRSMLRLASRYDCTIDHVNSKYFSNSIFQIAAVIETEKKLEATFNG